MPIPALAADYLFVGPAILARLNAEVPAWPVDLCERPEQVLEEDRRARVLMVMWGGDRFDTAPGGQARDGASQIMYQQWLAIVAVNNLGKQPDARQRDIGATMSAVHKALAGWQPPDAVTPLRRTTARLQPLFTKSKAIYPLAFEIRLSL